MIAWIFCLIMAGIAAGPILASGKKRWIKRLCGWLWMMALMTIADFVLNESNAVARMVGLCCVLLGSMKGLVYAEWAGEQRLTLSRYFVFAVCWFGMDPASFQHRRVGLRWKSDVLIGAVLMLVGTLGAWFVWAMEWRQIFLLFLPMSLGFHFGALRVLKGGLRATGFPVRTLFPNLLKARGIADFWSRRWNVGYSQMMQRIVGRPIEARYGADAGMMAIFLVSGILHELAITLPVRAGFGLPTLYFAIHGMLTLIEKKSGLSLGKIPSLLAVVLPLGMLFPPAFQREVIQECLGVFDVLQHLLAR